jgi:hypothetical protein
MAYGRALYAYLIPTLDTAYTKTGTAANLTFALLA